MWEDTDFTIERKISILRSTILLPTADDVITPSTWHSWEGSHIHTPLRPSLIRMFEMVVERYHITA